MGEDGGRGEMQHPGLGRRGPEGEFREACITCPFQGSAAVPWFVPFDRKGGQEEEWERGKGQEGEEAAGLEIPSSRSFSQPIICFYPQGGFGTSGCHSSS